MSSQFIDPEMQEIFEGFLIETQELLDSLSQDLMLMETSPDDQDLLNRIFRSFHTIKGTSSFMGFSSISEITHSAEDLLNKLRRSELAVSLEIVDVLLEVHDWIQLLVDKLNRGDTGSVDYSATLAQLEKLKTGELSAVEIPNQTDDLSEEVSLEQDLEMPDQSDETSYVNSMDEPSIENTEQDLQDLTETSDEWNETSESENDELGISAIDLVIGNKDMVTKPGDFTDEENALLEAAFAEMNLSLFKESGGFQRTGESDEEHPAHEQAEDTEMATQESVLDENFESEPKSQQEPLAEELVEEFHNTETDESATEPTTEITAVELEEHFEEVYHSQEPVTQEPIIEKISEKAHPHEQRSPITDKHQTSTAGSFKEQQSAASTTAQSKAKVAQDTIRIDVSRVETLMDLSGELVLGRNRLAQITEMLEHEFENKIKIRDLIETTAQIDFVTSEIQAAVMRMRMVPIGKLYQKAPRIVRDLAKEFNKQIQLVLKGEDTEIDRGIIEELNDPLVHMIRNSCDHGVEKPEDRAKAGKSPLGTITLDAEQEGNNIVLRISDDGKGMDPEKIKQKALEKGIITNDTAQQMSAREAFQLIFLPGFSTAQVVSAVSGRGVGMDVVRTNIQNLKGMIDIDSELGAGTTFVVKLPLTLAIIQGLLVKVKHEVYALPLSSVVEVVAVNINNIYTVNRQEVIRIRAEVLPIIRLNNALGVTKENEPLDDKNVVVVGFGLQRVGLVCDELLGQQEIVIKSLGEYLGAIPGIAGSTILGDGSVIMIIDVAELIQDVYSKRYQM